MSLDSNCVSGYPRLSWVTARMFMAAQADVRMLPVRSGARVGDELFWDSFLLVWPPLQ